MLEQVQHSHLGCLGLFISKCVPGHIHWGSEMGGESNNISVILSGLRWVSKQLCYETLLSRGEEESKAFH